MEWRCVGSSPRVWGTQLRRNPFSGVDRFIPTGVGNTTKKLRSCTRRTVHPHGCGEHPVSTSAVTTNCGSSPRVWGTLHTGPIARKVWRFIPTGVGNTSIAPTGTISIAVHPHGCGEHPGRYPEERSTCGSSPRVWGTRRLRFPGRRFFRFIPTGVGNTLIGERIREEEAVHPHGCGEHLFPSFSASALTGSSPRVWGTLYPEKYQADSLRFIPTGVGNTGADWVNLSPFSVHPHGCGEHAETTARLTREGGSSPRVWGTLTCCVWQGHYGRFIPTGVGNTIGSILLSLRPTVHPHGCGEHCLSVKALNSQNGSSPRVWGTRQGITKVERIGRFIPTGVGNTR